MAQPQTLTWASETDPGPSCTSTVNGCLPAQHLPGAPEDRNGAASPQGAIVDPPDFLRMEGAWELVLKPHSINKKYEITRHANQKYFQTLRPISMF